MEQTFRQALAHHNAGRLDEAEALYRQAAGWRPGWTLGNLGMILRITGRLEEAEAVLRAALTAEPENVRNAQSLSMTLLQLGRWAEGWRRFEARRVHAPPPQPDASIPEWRGEALAGKRLLVVGEQGLGDQILFARFIPMAAALAGEVLLVVGRPLARLFGELPARIIQPASWSDVEADFWIPLCSLPDRLGGPGPDDAPPLPLAASRPARPPCGVGLMLAGGLQNPNPSRLPPPPIAEALRGLRSFVDLDPAASGAADMADTAAIIAGLSQVLTVDTSVAHLAGAMGKRTLVLLPRPAVDWWSRWESDRTPWHAAARTMRQRRPEDWAGLIGEAAARLAEPASA